MYDFAGNLRVFFGSNAAIYIEGTFNNFTVSNNSIYQTQSISSSSSSGPFTIGGIKINSSVSSSFTVTNNIIGGGNASAGGSAWELGPVSDFNVIVPIDISVPSTSGISITNNTIRNYFLGGSATFTSFPGFCGIRYASNTKSTGVNISNNIIGRDTGNTSISIINEGAAPMTVVGIFIDAPDTSSVTCNSNSIGGFNMSGPGANNGFQFIGICMQSSGTVSNNLIGSLTTNSSIIASNTATAVQQTMVGISSSIYQQFGFRNEAINITGNTISGLRNNFNGTSNIDRLTGIDALETRELNISNNIIQRLISFSSSSLNNFFPVKGIQVNNTSFINQQNTTISGNIIRDVSNLSVSGSANVCGIIVNSASASLYDISRNFIHSLQVVSTSNNTQLTGIFLQDGESRLTNNMIRLGINASGTAVDAPAIISGVDIISSDNSSVWHNSIYIGGTIINSVSNSYALRRNGNGLLNLVNNILVNQRNFTAANTRRNFAIGLSGFNSFNADFNCYFRAGSGSGLAEVGSVILDSLSTWRNASGKDGASGIINPNFVNATGNVQTVDLHVFGTTPIESNGSLIAAVTLDFDGQIRSTLSPVDIGADAGLFTSVALPVKWKFFDLEKKNNHDVRISFGVTAQLNNNWFYVERSTDGNLFTEIARIKGELNTNVFKTYEHFDDISNLPKGIIYYRIKQVDTDDKSSTTAVKSILNNNAELLEQVMQAYPNPFAETITINYPLADTDGILEIFDRSGRLIELIKINKNTNSININTTYLEKGIYIIKLNGANAIKVVKTF